MATKAPPPDAALLLASRMASAGKKNHVTVRCSFVAAVVKAISLLLCDSDVL